MVMMGGGRGFCTHLYLQEVPGAEFPLSKGWEASVAAVLAREFMIFDFSCSREGRTFTGLSKQQRRVAESCHLPYHDPTWLDMKTLIPVDEAGRLVLPKAMRESLRLRGKGLIAATLAGNRVELQPVADKLVAIKNVGRFLAI